MPFPKRKVKRALLSVKQTAKRTGLAVRGVGNIARGAVSVAVNRRARNKAIQRLVKGTTQLAVAVKPKLTAKERTLIRKMKKL